MRRFSILLLVLGLSLLTATIGHAQCMQSYNSHVDDNPEYGPSCVAPGAGCGECVTMNPAPGVGWEDCYLDFGTWDEYCVTGGVDNQT
jgi:hypothetical protein